MKYKWLYPFVGFFLLTSLLVWIGFIIPMLTSPLRTALEASVEAAPLDSGLHSLLGEVGRVSGQSLAATGTLTGNEASKLSFSEVKHFVVINNQTGSQAFVKMNDITTTVSTTVYDFAIDDDEEVFISGWLAVENCTVYVSPTTGFYMIGW